MHEGLEPEQPRATDLRHATERAQLAFAGSDATVPASISTVFGIDLSRDTMDVATDPPTHPLGLTTDKAG